MIALHACDRPSINEVVDELTRFKDTPDRILMIDSEEKSVWIREDEGWQQICNVPEECRLTRMICCRVSDGILALGGGDLIHAGAQCHYLSLSGRQWKRMEHLQKARHWPAAVSLSEEEVFLFWGIIFTCNGSGIPLSVCEKLNVKTNTWTSIRDLPEPNANPLVTAANGKAYIIPRVPGVTSRGRIQLVEYDPTHDRYSVQSELPEDIKGTYIARLVGIVDQLYLIHNVRRRRDIPEYSLSTRQWSSILVPNTPTSPTGYLGEARSGKLIWCKGEDLYEYDRHTHQWRTMDYKLRCDHIGYRHFVTIVE